MVKPETVWNLLWEWSDSFATGQCMGKWILMKHTSVVVYDMGEYWHITFVKDSNENVYNKRYFNIII